MSVDAAENQIDLRNGFLTAVAGQLADLVHISSTAAVWLHRMTLEQSSTSKTDLDSVAVSTWE